MDVSCLAMALMAVRHAHCCSLLTRGACGFEWQGAITFNQDLSFNTASVTDMKQMFCVRGARQ